MTVNIESLFELQQTAAFYGCWIGYKGSRTNPGFIGLFQEGSDVEIASWNGEDTLERAILFCNNYFSDIENRPDLS